MILKARDLPLWEAAKPYLDVRSNDEHTLIAYNIAQVLLDLTPGADESVVLPAIVLHDVGWKLIPEELRLLAVGPKPTRKDLVREHEVQGVKIAREILQKCKPKGVDSEAVLAIIDGHDTTLEARSINDAVVKDADKGWRCTPHGMRTISGWYHHTLEEYVDGMDKTTTGRMLTAAGKAMSASFLTSLRAETLFDKYLGNT